MIDGLEVAVDRAGLSALRLSPVANSLRWTTAAVGGFGDCSFTLPGDPAQWKRQLPHLSTVRVVLDTFTLWEGRVEDITLTFGEPGSQVACFGFHRLLEDTPVRRIWSQRSIPWFDAQPGRIHTEALLGNFNDADMSQVGVRLQGTGQAVTAADFKRVRAFAPTGMLWTRWMGSHADAGVVANFHSVLQELEVGVSTTTRANLNGSGTFDIALGSNINGAQILMDYDAAYTNSESDRFDLYDMRLLGTSLTEDAAGGFYGGTILRDLIALVPGLTAGIIEDGSDFTIQSLERAVRDNARAIVDEVAGYYSREWAVWEDQLFDWRTPDLDAPGWLCPLREIHGGELTATVDGLASTVYVLYTDAADGRDKEASASSTSQRNPWVKQGKTRGELVQPGFPMTAASASQLASTLVAIDAQYPRIEGRVVVAAGSMLGHAAGARRPAFMVRAGDTLTIPDLPKSEFFTGGRDGETLFHVVGTEVDLEQGTATVEIEGQTRRSDVLLARLAAVTRTVAG